MIRINGREINLDNLRVKVERRRARGLLFGDEAAPEGLERLPDLSVRSYFGIQYRLHDSLARHGARLEPALDYGRRERGENRFVSRALRPWRKVKRKLISAPNEGYVKQQELFNTYAVKTLDAAARLYHAMRWEGQGPDRDEAPVAREAPELLGAEALDGLLSGTAGKVAFLGLPGPACLERALERGRLLTGVDPDDRRVAHYQSLFLPVFWQRPLNLPRFRDFSGCGAVVVTDPDALSAQGLDAVLAEARARLRPGAEVLLRVSQDGWLSPGGFARAASRRGEVRWTAEYLSWMLERHGYRVKPEQWGEALFLRGTDEAAEEAAEVPGGGTEGG